jgi:signal transduction histidine kinase
MPSPLANDASASSDIQSDEVPCQSATPATILRTLSVLSTTTFMSLQAALDAYLDMLMCTLAMRSAFVARLDEGKMFVLEALDHAGCGIPHGGVVPLEETFCQYVRAHHTVIAIPDASNDPRVADVATRHDFNIGSYLGAPITFSDGTLFGTLCALDPAPRAFVQHEFDLMTIMARHLAALLEREYMQQVAARSVQAADHDLHAALGALDNQRNVLRIATHDLRSPLAGIIGGLELLRYGASGPLSTEQHEDIEQLLTTSRYLNRLVTDLLDAALVDTPAFTLVTQPYDPRAVVQTVLEASQPVAAARGLQLSATIADDLPAITGDRDRTQQVLFNLIGNALRYTRNGSVELRVTPLDEVLEFRVLDTGLGIVPEALAKVWNQFARGSQRQGSYGLGLYIVQRLVCAMGGTISASSTPDVGSCFVVRLPLHGPRPAMIPWEVEEG